MSEDPFDLPPEVLGQVPLLAEIAKVLSWRGGPVNWDLARQLAVAVAAQGGAAPEPSQAHVEEAREDVRVAELWLAEATGLPSPSTLPKVQAVAPPAWAARTTELYREIIDPIAQRVTASIGDEALPEGEGRMIAQALGQLAPLFLGVQTGAVLGTLAGDVLGQYDVPVPPSEEGSVALVLPTIDAFAAAYGLDRRETRLWAALHESAHRLELEGLSWVSAHFFALYHNYVAGIEVELGGMAERLRSLDFTNPAALQDALEGQSLFGTAESPAMRAALERVETFVAVLEAWADAAIAAAAARLPGAPRLAEATARRRAEERRGERLFRRFVGIDFRSEARRAADGFVRAVLGSGGWATLNRIWHEPEGLPRAEELAAPESWIRRAG